MNFADTSHDTSAFTPTFSSNSPPEYELECKSLRDSVAKQSQQFETKLKDLRDYEAKLIVQNQKFDESTSNHQARREFIVFFYFKNIISSFSHHISFTSNRNQTTTRDHFKATITENSLNTGCRILQLTNQIVQPLVDVVARLFEVDA